MSPVVDYDDTLLRDALHRLERKLAVRLARRPGHREERYAQLLREAVQPTSSVAAP